MRLLLASNNAKKLAELRQLLGGLPVTLVAQGDLSIAEAEEPFATFVENALHKARCAAHASGGPALADDSGLCVDALGGAPGVASADYAGALTETGEPGEPAEREARRARQDAANNALLLQRMAGREPRSARFVCTLVALRSANDPEPLIAQGRWEGELLDAPRGSGGFGYDPLVFIAPFGLSVAQLSAQQKSQSSHRALACVHLTQQMREVWHLG